MHMVATTDSNGHFLTRDPQQYFPSEGQQEDIARASHHYTRMNGRYPKYMEMLASLTHGQRPDEWMRHLPLRPYIEVYKSKLGHDESGGRDLSTLTRAANTLYRLEVGQRVAVRQHAKWTCSPRVDDRQLKQTIENIAPHSNLLRDFREAAEQQGVLFATSDEIPAIHPLIVREDHKGRLRAQMGLESFPNMEGVKPSHLLKTWAQLTEEVDHPALVNHRRKVASPCLFALVGQAVQLNRENPQRFKQAPAELERMHHIAAAQGLATQLPSHQARRKAFDVRVEAAILAR